MSPSGWGLESITDIAASESLLARRRSGRIVTQDGELVAVDGRWWPYFGNMMQVMWDRHARSCKTDRCELYYHAPFGSPGFLTLSYVRSGPQTSLATFYGATLVLDEVARLRRDHAIVCHVTNSRISNRLMARWGWQPHCQHWAGRHFIKRFYGNYPPIKNHWRKALKLKDQTDS